MFTPNEPVVFQIMQSCMWKNTTSAGQAIYWFFNRIRATC